LFDESSKLACDLFLPQEKSAFRQFQATSTFPGEHSRLFNPGFAYFPAKATNHQSSLRYFWLKQFDYQTSYFLFSRSGQPDKTQQKLQSEMSSKPLKIY
jgi:hypothetical protein